MTKPIEIITKPTKPVSLVLKTLTLALVTAALSNMPASALTFTFSFVNTGGNVGSPTDVITGKVWNLPDNTITFSPTKVTVDSVSPTVDPAFTVPQTWIDPGVFDVSGGHLLSISFSGDNGAYVVNIDSANASYFALDGFSKYYLGSYAGSVGNSTVVTPDGGSTMVLFGIGLAGVGLIRRKLAGKETN